MEQKIKHQPARLKYIVIQDDIKRFFDAHEYDEFQGSKVLASCIIANNAIIKAMEESREIK